MENLLLGCIAFASVCAGILFIFIARYYINTMKLDNQEFKYRQEKDITDTPFNMEILNLLDTIIAIRWNDVLAKNLDLLTEGAFINKKLEDQLRDELKTKIKESLTPCLYAKIILVYDAKTLTDIIGDKVYNIVLAFKLETNNKMVESKK